MTGIAIDRTGERYGRLTVQARAGSSADGHTRWRCTCSCAYRRTVCVRADALVSGSTKSCGCLMRARLWSAAERRTLRKYINLVPYGHLATLIPGRTIDAIKQRATLLGLQRSGRRFPRLARNENFFARKGDLTTAYWAGFIAADGCVVVRPRRELRIALHRRDETHLKQFCAASGYTGKLYPRAKSIVSLTVCAADRWIDDLRNRFDIGPRKTLTLRPPVKLTRREALAYSIGYIDGDGCWARERQSERLILVIIGTRPVVRWLRSLWVEAGASVGGAQVRPSRGCHRLSIRGRHAESIAYLLGRIHTPKLERKWRVARGEALGQTGA